MPITSARTSPPSGLLSCSVLAARALSRRTPDAEIKAMVNMIFQDAGIAHFLNKFPLHALRPNLRHPGVEAGHMVSTRRGQTFGQRALAINIRVLCPLPGSPFYRALSLRTPGWRVRLLIGTRRNRHLVLGQGAETYWDVAALQK